MILKCKKCGHEKFKAVVSVVAELRLDSDQGFIIDSVDQETCSCQEVMCIHCNEIVDPESLLVVPCSKCGKFFDESELDEDGCCKACNEIHSRGWEGLTIQDYMFKILELEKNLVDTTKEEPEKKATRKKSTKVEKPTIQSTDSQPPVVEVVKETIVEEVDTVDLEAAAETSTSSNMVNEFTSKEETVNTTDFQPNNLTSFDFNPPAIEDFASNNDPIHDFIPNEGNKYPEMNIAKEGFAPINLATFTVEDIKNNNGVYDFDILDFDKIPTILDM